MAYKCYYCDVTLTHTSLKVKKKHLTGKKHRERVAIYWLQVGKHLGRFNTNASIDTPTAIKTASLDQTSELNVFKVPGLHPEADKIGPAPTIPPPANIPTTKFPKQSING